MTSASTPKEQSKEKQGRREGKESTQGGLRPGLRCNPVVVASWAHGACSQPGQLICVMLEVTHSSRLETILQFLIKSLQRG